ncbi:PcfJ domain-containing protein [Desulfosporosinus sp.]|uniref:PcfJ domain-containing protein n=1 Tax=Desulfosporosinus sp. TaxID=157907 RepID=UPI0025BA8FC7|nr:PcfJ domain-containing protein [Desulfosporosinus sp.]MBC2721820.1 PcfJ domain-containing protein [Desulfosporosinus sp.]MBC2726276.1 PcfJ domain-containing protein [Desulfosporosinus sp.]
MFTEYMDHFPEGLSPDILRYATDDVFRHSRYIFTRRQGKQQYGYCTHCKQEFKTNGYSHNSTKTCPECNSACTVKASGLRRKKLIDEAYFVYYEKSPKDPGIIIARGIYAVRDYSDNYHFVQTICVERTRYIFTMGKSLMFERYGYYSKAKTMQHGTFDLRKSVHSIYSQYNADNMRFIATKYSQESIREAVKDTPFGWSGWESYHHQDMVKFFDLYSKYPSIEYLTKLGFEDIVKAKLAGEMTYSTINWRGKTLFKVLRLSKKEFNEIKASKVSLDPLFLKIMQLSRKDGSNLSPTEIGALRKQPFHLNDLLITLKHTSLRKSFNYLTGQLEKNSKHFANFYNALTTWRDYIADCITLEMNLKDEMVLFPRNLYTAHQNTIKQIKLNEDKALNVKIKLRTNYLKTYYFEHLGLFIRAAESTGELINEGSALHHCVGGYAARYAKGETDILFIRKVSEPDKPYFTVEIKSKTIWQVRGRNNCSYPPGGDVDQFIKAFTNKKLTPKKEKARVLVPA